MMVKRASCVRAHEPLLGARMMSLGGLSEMYWAQGPTSTSPRPPVPTHNQQPWFKDGVMSGSPAPGFFSVCRLDAKHGVTDFHALALPILLHSSYLLFVYWSALPGGPCIFVFPFAEH